MHEQSPSIDASIKRTKEQEGSLNAGIAECEQLKNEVSHLLEQSSKELDMEFTKLLSELSSF